MNLADLRATSDLIAGLDDEDYAFFESLATGIDLEPDEILFRENDEARRFFLVAKGIVSLEVERAAKPSTIVQTVSEGALLGLSWRLTPHRWMWTARALTDATIVVFDAANMREVCDRDPDIDRLMWKALALEASKRLHHARIQLLDLYGSG